MTAITGPYDQAPNPANEYIGRGKLFIDRFDANGNRTGQQDVGNVTVLEVEDKVETKEKYESMDPASNLYARAVVRQTVSLKITGDEFTLDNIARVLNGTVEQITEPGAAVVAETVTPSGGAVLGRYYDLAFRNVTAFTDLKQGATSLVEGTDFTIDLLNGRVYLLPTSATITAGSALTADYTYGGYTYNAVNVGKVSAVDAYVKFIGDPVKGHQFQHEWWHVQFTPTGSMGFIKDDFGEWQLEGMVLADPTNHPNEPLGRIIQVA